MSSSFKEIEEYVPTVWHNYNPPSIDQINLKHIEDNIKLNRDTINEIIRRLGEIPDNIPVPDQPIYNTSIYDTLKSLRDRIKNVEDNKLNASTYNSQIGDFSQLQDSADPKTIVHAINNRLRKDQEDTTTYKLTIGTIVGTGSLSVGGAASITGNLSVTGTGTFTGKINGNGSIGTTTLTTSGKATLNSLEVTGATALKSTLSVTGASTLSSVIASGEIDARNGLKVQQLSNNTWTTKIDLKTNGESTFNGEMVVQDRVAADICWSKADYVQIGAPRKFWKIISYTNITIKYW